jgi:hypothetical protein
MLRKKPQEGTIFQIFEMERPAERNGKTQMISGIQEISFGQKH